MKKYIAFLIVCLTMLLLLTGCAQNSQGGTAQAGGERIPIKIIYPVSRGMAQKNVTAFRDWVAEKYPEVDLEMVSSAVTTVTDTVKSELKNGNGPDIFITTDYDSFVNEGLLADITDIKALTVYRRSIVRTLERDNRVYALPLGGGNLVGLHYNDTLFKEYGLEPPKDTETMEELLNRLTEAIEEKGLDVDVMGASMLYPAQISVVMNGIMSEWTQALKFLKWSADYSKGTTSFEDEIFQDYLQKIEVLMKQPKSEDTDTVPSYSGKVFTDYDFSNAQQEAIDDFLNGGSLLYLGDVSRCYDSMGNGYVYGKNDICVMGIPINVPGVSYVSYMDDIFMGVNADFNSYSPRKQQVIKDILNYVASGEPDIQGVFTFTGKYCSVYLDGKSPLVYNDPYFEKINSDLTSNYVAQEVSNTPYAHILGKTISVWYNNDLKQYMTEGSSDIEKVTKILEMYRTQHISVYEKSAEPIGTSAQYMAFKSNIVRTQETEIGNQLADMARSYMQSDFALINAGAIRASMPEGEISMQTINSIIPYTNYLVKIKVSGATLKKALENAYNVGPTYKAGKFGEISGLRVVLETNPAGYEEYSRQYAAFLEKNPSADDMQKMEASKNICEKICRQDANALNLKLVSVTDSSGNPIEDHKIYTVATLNYLLKGQDGYTMLGILEGTADADTSIEIYDREGNRIEGKTGDEMEDQIIERCETGAEAFSTWIQEGNAIGAQIDGRITINNFIYFE